MGAWPSEPFGNDTAPAGAAGLTESTDLSYVQMALDKVVEQGDAYLETPDAEEAVAAIEVIARLLGKGTQTDAYTTDVDAWVNAVKQKPDSALLDKARRTTDRILSSNSELREL